jgi:hypothetical protein
VVHGLFAVRTETFRARKRSWSRCSRNYEVVSLIA